jgi:integrase
MTLTELMIKQAKPKEKSYTLSDGKGLLLEVFPNGRKRWVVRYWLGGREKRTSIGTFPDVSLKAARDRNYELRKNLASGKLPNKKSSENFADVASEWLDIRMKPLYSPNHVKKLNAQLNKYILPPLGELPLINITTGIVLNVCREIENKGYIEIAKRVRTVVGQVFRYAIATDRVDYDPTYGLKDALQTRKGKHFATITDPKNIVILARRIDEYPFLVVRCALKWSMLTFCRPGEIREAKWEEIDMETARWNIPEERMKMKRPHIVPLSRQALTVLETLRPITGYQKWLFPSARNNGGCMASNTLRYALRTMGYGNEDMTAHGFRAMASTVLNDHEFNRDHIEVQLAHAPKNAIRDTYNHAEYLSQRREMMQWYADWLDNLKSS